MYVQSNKVLHTDGSGYWSHYQRPVKLVKLTIGYINDEEDFGELRVFFDTETWDNREHGLIYTDNLFLTELRQFLDSVGLPGYDVDYSEQGMQGRNYVSLDVGKPFLDKWNSLTTVDLVV